MFEENTKEDQKKILEIEEKEKRQYNSRRRVKAIIISILFFFIISSLIFMTGYSSIFGIYFELVVKPVPNPDYNSLLVLFVTFLTSGCLYIASSCFGISAVLKGDNRNNLIRIHYGMMVGFLLNNAIFPIGSRIIQGMSSCNNTNFTNRDDGRNPFLDCVNTPSKLPCPYIPKMKFAIALGNVLSAMCIIVQLCLYIVRDSILGVDPWKELEKEEEDRTLNLPYQFDGIIPLFELVEVDPSIKPLALIKDVDDEDDS